jgi:predicted TIM-barrel fold metal-dependent hydrolase
MFLKNGLQCVDLITSGVLPRFPELQFVSVESGIGWVPFVLEAADHSYLEGRPGRASEWELLPSEYFARQVYTTYWFESVAPTKLLGAIPVDRILFETDFPHPTCLYGNVHEKIESSLAGATEEQRRRILWENAAELYRVELPGPVRARS